MESSLRIYLYIYKQFLLAALFGCALAAPIDESGAEISKFHSNAESDGSYAYEVEQTNGISASEKGTGGIGAQGFYSYTSPEGVPVLLTYVADENGFHPQSDLLPTPPPIPEDILRSIQFNKEHPTPEELADRAVRAQQI